MGTVERIRPSDLEVMQLMDVVPFQEFSSLEEVFVMGKDAEWVVQELLDE